ncbi:DUF402 domain-containing protein [Mycoplasma buteonis]|uniref:DUF402 domain-containing protein n=1 Tax=Mycoplasma buteonis TaxID=171280 RepID=UPI000561B7DA|nr:DUF402 domain-containing protein [Mycoplasma buteonis]
MSWDFKNIKTGQIINVQAYKHNGFLYRQWNGAKVIFHNKRHIVLFLRGTRVTESHNETNGWRYTESAIWFLPKDSFYNAIVLFKKNVGSYYYINMASKPIFEDNTLKFIDYDLDIKCYPEKDLQIVDREEFGQNSKQMDYPLKLKEKIHEEIKNIVSMYNNYEYFFNTEILEYYLKIAVQDKLITQKTIDDFVILNRKKYSEESEIFLQTSKVKNFNYKKAKH